MQRGLIRSQAKQFANYRTGNGEPRGYSPRFENCSRSDFRMRNWFLLPNFRWERRKSIMRPPSIRWREEDATPLSWATPAEAVVQRVPAVLPAESRNGAYLHLLSRGE